MKRMKAFKQIISILVVALFMTMMASVAFADDLQYKVAGVDSQNKDFPATNLEDPNHTSMWHSEFDPAPVDPPHWIVLDLGAVYSVNGLKYLPRQDNNNSNGHVTDYNIYVSQDNKTFKKVASGTWEKGDNKIEDSASFDPADARYVKLEAVKDQFMAAQRITISGTKTAAAGTTKAADTKAPAAANAAPANPKTSDTGTLPYIAIAILSSVIFFSSKKIKFNK
jgi:hypothetical protein